MNEPNDTGDAPVARLRPRSGGAEPSGGKAIRADGAEGARARLTAYLDSVDLEWELGGRDGEYVVSLPGDQKLRTVVSILVRERTTSLSAFVIRNPDENHAEFYRYLLRRNLRLAGVAYAVDADGDVYVRGQLPNEAVGERRLDEVLGVVLAAADAAFNELLVLGFLSSMRREWAWRVSRGEPTANLEAFRHLIEG